MRVLWLIGGLLSLLLGLVGVFLPLLPTVPFLLLTAFCFARSSDRLHDWLMTHPRLGPPIHDWRSRGAIGKRAKLAATVSVFATFGISVALGLSATILGIQAITLGAVMIFIWTRPAR